MKMDGPELLLAASGGILAASAAVCLIRCRGRLRKILAVWTGVFAGALLTLALGGWLLARAELEWRGWVICVLYHAALGRRGRDHGVHCPLPGAAYGGAPEVAAAVLDRRGIGGGGLAPADGGAAGLCDVRPGH